MSSSPCWPTPRLTASDTATTSGSTPEEFAASLRTTAERIAADSGMRRFERQRGGARLRTWTDRPSGMWRLSGTFDPESGARTHGRLEAAIAAIAAMFATKTPSTTPSDPGEKQDLLLARALLALTTAGANSTTRPVAKSTPPANNNHPVATGPRPLLRRCHSTCHRARRRRDRRRRCTQPRPRHPTREPSPTTSITRLSATCAVPGCNVTSRHDQTWRLTLSPRKVVRWRVELLQKPTTSTTARRRCNVQRRAPGRLPRG